MVKYYVCQNGKYLGSYYNGEVPNIPGGATEVPSAPNHPSQYWNGSSWINEQVYVDKKDDANRKARYEILLLTDHSQLPDAPYTSQEVTDFQTYRNDLRDLPNDVNWPLSHSWPSAPVQSVEDKAQEIRDKYGV